MSKLFLINILSLFLTIPLAAAIVRAEPPNSLSFESKLNSITSEKDIRSNEINTQIVQTKPNLILNRKNILMKLIASKTSQFGL